MFTSRAEYRLLLREESADIRLMEYGKSFGLINEATYQKMISKKDAITNAIEFLEAEGFTSKKENLEILESLNEEKISDKVWLVDIIGRNTINVAKFDILVPGLAHLDDYIKEQIIVEAKYYRYVTKQQKQIDKMRKMMTLKIPDNFIFDDIPGLSKEIIEKLKKHTPATLFAASEVSGVTPAALDILYLYINMRGQKSQV